VPLAALAASNAGWSDGFADAIRPRCAAEAALSAVRARELRTVLDALHAAGTRPLLIKGAALEWTHYPAAGTRPRADTDLLIDEADRDAVRGAVEALGYQPLAHVTGDVAFTQFHYWRIDDAGARHALDVHWRIVNPRIVSDRIPYGDLYPTRVRVPQLGPYAYAPANTDALQIACLHRSAHHRDSDLLIWLCDIHLLASALTRAEWMRTVESTVQRGLDEFVAAGLDRAARRFNTSIPAEHRERLARAGLSSRDGISPFAPGRAGIHLLLSDLRHTAGWTNRLRFLREHLLPPPAYMAHRYRTSNRAVLPFLYVHRILAGARKFF
jgi:hypothetical protein